MTKKGKAVGNSLAKKQIDFIAIKWYPNKYSSVADKGFWYKNFCAAEGTKEEFV